MEPAEQPEHIDEPDGICRRCGNTFVDVFDFQGSILPDYVPVRLAEYRRGDETTLAEWCSRACLLDEITKDPHSLIARIASAPADASRRDDT